jgi:hypothetical protein
MDVTNEDDKIAMRVLGKDKVVGVDKKFIRKDKVKIFYPSYALILLLRSL